MSARRLFARTVAVLSVPVVVAAVAPLVVGACGSSDGGGAGGSGGTLSDASVESGANASGASAGNAGTATGSGGNGAAGPRDGSPESDAGDGDDAGPTCPPPPRAPDASFTTGGTCTAAAACGGALTGTFMLQSLCASDLFATVRGVCSTAQIDVTDDSARGGIAFDGKNVTMSLHAKTTASVTFPNNCSFCQCSALEGQLASAGLPSASCSPVCNSGSCTCTVSGAVDFEGRQSYTVAGGVLSTDKSLSFDYCLKTGALTLADSSSSSGFKTATFTAQAPPPEICDGLDNDLNGVIDDNPVECPTCSHTGVCASGFTATCGGTQGWTCSYTSPKYELTEQSCDGLDNDCNGVVDKLPTCEICDGVDNDGNGAIDDHLTDTPVCSKAGVCASGTTASCAGTDGWQCQGTAAAFELVETKCDGLDNDCDGVVDEACPACSGMKDLWLAGTTATLDLYRGAPTAATGQKLLSTTGSASKLAVDTPASKVYWVNPALTPPAIQRANFDGSAIETLAATIATGASPIIGGMAIDPGKDLYWFAGGSGIVRAPLASLSTKGAAQTIVTGVSASELAVAGSKLYYNDALTRSLSRSELDGSSPQVLVPFSVDEFVVDIIGNHIYWLSWFDFASLNIWETNLDGFGQKRAASGYQFTDDFNLTDFAVDPWQKTIFVVSNDYIQEVPVGDTTRAQLVSWATNLTAITLGGCAP